MDFYIDIAFAVLFRILKDRKQVVQWRAALRKLYLSLDNQKHLFLSMDERLAVDQKNAEKP